MPNIASALKAEIARIARKELRTELESLRKLSTQQRSAIAALKRQIADLQKQLERAARSSGRAQDSAPEQEADKKLRFSAERLAAHRQKLGLSAKDYGALVGVSGLSIYKWEKGEVRPRAKQLQALAAVRNLGKRAVAARIVQQSS